MKSPDELASELSRRGLEWADLDAAANALEEARKSLLAELSLQWTGESRAAANDKALASAEYKLHVAQMCTARKEANRARVRYDTYKVYVELERTAESTRRAEVKAIPG